MCAPFRKIVLYIDKYQSGNVSKPGFLQKSSGVLQEISKKEIIFTDLKNCTMDMLQKHEKISNTQWNIAEIFVPQLATRE
jgi:hypothetical protein